MSSSVILGAGLGGTPAAYELRDILPPEHRVTAVNAVDCSQFTRRPTRSRR